MKKWLTLLFYGLVLMFAVSGGEVCAAEISDAGYQRITYQGSDYEYNSQIKVIMFVGIDSEGELTTYNRYSVAPRADTIDLLILDDYHKKMKLLTISRDTITTIDRYAMNGERRNPYDTQIGYAFSYGDGGKASCENLVNAVSRLLGGVPIHEYVVTNTSSLPFSNNGRMERQGEYIREYLKKFREMILEDPEQAWNQMETMRDSMLTSITKNQYLKLADLMGGENLSDADCYYLEGKNVQEGIHDAFYPEEEKLYDMIVELFYLER